MEIRVVNSETKLSGQKCKMINQGIKSNTSHGLSMLYQKLNAIYGTAEAVGYQNLNHFYKYFHIHMGVTPATYMKQGRDEELKM